MNNKPKISRSVSLYSYQQPYYEGKLDLEGCIREVAKTGATGIELLAEQMIDDFPVITPAFQDQWFGWMEKYGTEPTCYDAFLENRIYDNRTLTLREQIEMMARDINIASQLGFKTLRTLVATPIDVIEGSLEYAAKKDIKICLEVHSPFSFNSTWADGYMRLIQKTGTQHFGFIPDFGIFCRDIPQTMRDQAFRFGASQRGVELVDEAFKERVSNGFVKIEYDLDLGRAHRAYLEANGYSKLMEALKQAGANEADFKYAGKSFTFTWNDPQDLIDNMPCIFHTHAKCYDLTPDYIEPSMPLDEIVAAYKKGGYTGYLSTEYEGHGFLNDAFEVDSIEQVRRHQEALKRAIEK